jgi:hypothetical protein
MSGREICLRTGRILTRKNFEPHVLERITFPRDRA